MAATGRKGRSRAGAFTLGLLFSGGFAVQLAAATGSSSAPRDVVARAASLLPDSSVLGGVLRQQGQGQGQEGAFFEKWRFLQGIETPSPVGDSGGDTPSPSDVDDENAVVTPSPVDNPGDADTPNPTESRDEVTTPNPSVAQDSATTPNPSPTEGGATPNPVVAEDNATPNPTLTPPSDTPNPSMTGDTGTTPNPSVAGDTGTTPNPSPTPTPTQDDPTPNPSVARDGATPNPSAVDYSTGTPAPDSEEDGGETPSDDGETPSPAVEDGETPSPAVDDGETPAPDQEPTGTGAPFAPSTCSNGIPGVQDGAVCCLEACGQCGGTGCGAIAGTEGASDCCPSTIMENAAGEFCGEAPCVIEGITPAPTTVPGTPAPFAPSTCSNGIPGVSTGNVCCKENCGLCGGEGCGAVDGTNGASDCCPDTIIEESGGVFCGDADAPCVMEGFTPSPVNPASEGTAAPVEPSTCSNGLPGYQDRDACCLEACGQCGGSGCGTIPGTGGSENCCSSTIRDGGTICGEPPCIIEGYTPAPAVIGGGTAAPVVPSTCSNGLAGYQDLDVCCVESCGQCGGDGCGTIPGTGGANSCCSSSVREVGEDCGVTLAAPCIIGGYTPSPVNPAFLGTAAPVEASMCSNGLAGVQNGAACCSENCGQCGGEGCGSIPGTGGSSNCCASSVLEANVLCGNGVEAPCVIDNYTPAPAGVPGQNAPFAASTCVNGMPGVQSGAACCEERCGLCGGLGCGAVPGTAGSSSCCSSTILAEGVPCDDGVQAPCFFTDFTPAPAAVPGEVQPFAASTCVNGIPGVQSGEVCCEENCGQCGGEGCGTIPGTAGASSCCPSTVLSEGVPCNSSFEAPCFFTDFTPAPAVIDGVQQPFAASTCENGMAGIQNGIICCAENCGQCGGAGCGSIPGTGGSDYCCSTAIAINGTDCSVTLAAPCIMGNWVPTPAPAVLVTASPVVPSTCSNGIPGYQDGSACCKMSCGLCGGVGCGSVRGTAGSSDCCPTDILESNQTCNATVEAPCIIPPTPAPTMAPAAETPVPFVSGNARDFTNAADSARGRPGVLSVMTALSAVLAALAFGGGASRLALQ